MKILGVVFALALGSLALNHKPILQDQYSYSDYEYTGYSVSDVALHRITQIDLAKGSY